MQVKGPTWHKMGEIWGCGALQGWGWIALLQARGPVSPFPCMGVWVSGAGCPRWVTLPAAGHAAMARHYQSSFSLSHQLGQRGQILPLALGTRLVQAPILATSECCRVKIPQITGEGAAGSVQGAWAEEEQAALAHRGSGQAVLLPALRLCHAVPAVPEPTCLPCHPVGGHGRTLDLAREVWMHTGPLPLAAASIPMHFWIGAARALPAWPWKWHKLHRPSIQNHHGVQGGVPRVRGTYSAPFP